MNSVFTPKYAKSDWIHEVILGSAFIYVLLILHHFFSELEL
jgi:hypothetical protein